MRAKQGILHIFYTWLVVGLATWQLYLLFPALELDRGRELLVVVFLGVLAEWLSVAFPRGQLSGSFALVLSTFFIYGPAATAWVSGLSAMLGQGIANRGNPMRTTLFNAGQYVLASVAAGQLFQFSGGVPGPVNVVNILPLAAFTLAYMTVNHLLVYFYLLPDRRCLPHLAWLDTIKWDGLTYLFTVPLGLLIAMIYGYIGLVGTLLLFFSVLALQFILRFYVRLQVVNRELTAFYEAAKFLEGNPGPDAVMKFILNSAGRTFSYHTGVVYLRSGEEDTFLPAAVAGPYSKQLRTTAVYTGEGIIGGSLISREPEIIFDSRVDPRTRNEAGLCQVLRSLIMIPLFSGKEALGVIVLGDKRPLAFDEKHLHIMTVLGGQAAIAVENAVLNSRLEQIWSRDALTGLLRFSSFSERASEVCESATEAGAAVGVILVNIDHFKTFNQRYGRDAGERALAELAVLITSGIRRGDFAARYGGDEFALLLPGAGGSRLLDMAETLWQEIRGHAFLRGESRLAKLTVSVGVAELPRDAGDATGLFKAVQRALEKAKTGGGDRVESAAVPLEEPK